MFFKNGTFLVCLVCLLCCVLGVYCLEAATQKPTQVFTEYDALVAKSEAAIKKLEAVKQEEPIFPTKE